MCHETWHICTANPSAFTFWPSVKVSLELLHIEHFLIKHLQAHFPALVLGCECINEPLNARRGGIKSWHVKPKTTQPRDSWAGKKKGSQQNKCSNMNEKWSGIFYFIKSLSFRMCECVLWGAFRANNVQRFEPASFREHKSEQNVSPFTLHTGTHKHVTKQTGGWAGLGVASRSACPSTPDCRSESMFVLVFQEIWVYYCVQRHQQGEAWQSSGALNDVGRNIFSLHFPFREVLVPTKLGCTRGNIIGMLHMWLQILRVKNFRQKMKDSRKGCRSL